MKMLLLLFLTFSSIYGAPFESDTFPNSFLGTWACIESCTMGNCQVVPLDQRPSQNKIIITKDSLLSIENSIIGKTDSCDIDTSNSCLYIFGNTYFLSLSGDTLMLMCNVMLGVPWYYYLRTGTGTLFNNHFRPTQTTQIRSGKPFILNCLGQTELKSNVTHILINSKSNKTFLNIKQ